MTNGEDQTHNNGEGLRGQARRAARRFKGNWLELARFVSIVHERKAFRQWGFPSFESYCSRELKIRQQTAVKLLRSYLFLRKEEPVYLESAGGTAETPDWESVNLLRRAATRRKTDPEDYSRMRDDVLVSALPPPEIKERYDRFLRPPKRDNDEERNKRIRLKRVLASLKNVRQLIGEHDLLPGAGLDPLESFIRRIEERLEEID